MNEIMIRCPETGKDICTGIYSDPATFDLTSFFVSHPNCPVCGRQHSWSKSDAWLGDKEAPLRENERHQTQSNIFDSSI